MTVRDDGATVSVTALSKGSAVARLRTPQAVGVHTIVVTYIGDRSVDASFVTVRLTVTKAH